jgi:hypothetical protein
MLNQFGVSDGAVVTSPIFCSVYCKLPLLRSFLDAICGSTRLLSSLSPRYVVQVIAIVIMPNCNASLRIDFVV